MKRAPAWVDDGLVERDAARVAVDDRGLTLADGLFETLRVREGVALWLEDHLERLAAGAAVLGLTAPPAARMREAVGAVVAAAGPVAEDGALRLTVTRGRAAMRGLWAPAGAAGGAVAAAGATLLVTIDARSAPVARPSLVVSNVTRRNEWSPLAGVKALGYGDSMLARREALARGADDALLLNTAGRLACATVANVFVRVDGRWVTPPLTEGVLPGLARARWLGRLGAQEAAVDAAGLARAEAVLLCNSLGSALAGGLEGRELGRPLDAQGLEGVYADPLDAMSLSGRRSRTRSA